MRITLMTAVAVASMAVATAHAGSNMCDGTVRVGKEWTTVKGDTGDYVPDGCRVRTESNLGRRIIAACPDGSECQIELPSNSRSSTITRILQVRPLSTYLPPAPPPGAQMTIPLKPGFYVDADTPCGEASNASMLLVGRTGIWGNRERCSYRKIEQKGATYKVMQQCGQSTSAAAIEMISDSAFRSAVLGNKRHCPQNQLPEPWRNNDISNLIK